MKRITTGLGAILLLAILAACAPGVTFTAEDGARVFDMRVDGQIIEGTGNTFSYRTTAYDIDFRLDQDFIEFELVNNSDSTIRLLWDESAIVLPEGQTTRVVNGETSWPSRSDPQAPSVIPAGAKLSDAFYPLENARFSSGWSFQPMFEYPLQSRTTISLLVALEIEGIELEQTFTWVGEASRQEAP